MTGKSISAKKIEDTELWRLLQNSEDGPVKPLITQLPVLCQEASDRMKVMPSTSPLYTLHDETHLLRVTELMALVLGKTKNVLNSVELCLLILSAHFHDQGMVIEDVEYQELSSKPEFLVFRDNWYLEHPNRQEIDSQFNDPHITPDEKSRLALKISEIESAILSDYLRDTHAERSANYVLSKYSGDKRLEVGGINIAQILSLICKSHYLPVNILNPVHGFQYDEQIARYYLNVPYLAVLLRLADILDFDADRTPDVLFRAIHFTNDVSLNEWEKHRGIKGWTINKDIIRYTAKYSHPAYQAAALKLMDWIDEELGNCHALCRSFPAKFQNYELLLPSLVDRSRIGPQDGKYIYQDLEISLSRDEIVKLLMADKLYNRPYICIRELLQNSIDALRYRKTLFACADLEWNDGRVELSHFLDEKGYEVIRCKDNGAGMDMNIVSRFLTKAGRSYYRSPEFDRERSFFREKGVDFDPCSQFGIGFMSCFMLGDRITIKTRRDYGPGRNLGGPLIVEVNGLGGILIIKDGDSGQEPGTTVTITSRKKPSFLDEWTDQVMLTTVLKGFAIATEFPIVGRCTIPELTDEVVIPTEPSKMPTLIEKIGIPSHITLEQQFNEVNDNLYGSIRESFLVSNDGVPTLANKDASWEGVSRGTSKLWQINYDGRSDEFHHWRDSQIAIDGILLCGEPGRSEWHDEVKMRLGSYASNIYDSPYILDVRGRLKPEITPARTPAKDSMIDLPPKWKRLTSLIRQASGRLWEQIAEFIPKGLPIEEFWKLIAVYNGNAAYIRAGAVWDLLSVPLTNKDGTMQWVKFSALDKLKAYYCGDNRTLKTLEGLEIGPNPSFEEWEKQGAEHPSIKWQINSLVLSLSTLTIHDGSIIFQVKAPDDQLFIPAAYILSSDTFFKGFIIKYSGKASESLVSQTVIKTANRSHPLVHICLDSQYLERHNLLHQFASTFVPCIADAVCSNKQKELFKKPNRWMKYAAHCYYAIDWTKYDKVLQPPYKICLEGGDWLKITEADMQRWRDAEVKAG